MKTPHLLASFAVAATVSAADLKDPAIVAREWGESTDATSSLTDDLSLKGQISTGPRMQPQVYPPVRPPSRVTNPLNPRREDRQPDTLYDAPAYRAPEKLPNQRPRGAVPWEYNGEVYWLVPLSSPR